jgi:urea-proton symporter
MMSWQNALVLTLGYVVAMLVVTWISKKKQETAADFLVMNRKLGVFGGAFSIAASWIWAPAVFICSQKSFEQGLPGIFWFTAPNILCFFTFVPIALRARALLPQGYSMPDYLYARFDKSKAVHGSALVVYFGYQLGAIIINALAGGILITTLTGLPVSLCIILMTGSALSYSLISGLRASVITDVVQMCLILFMAFILVPWVMTQTGGFDVLQSGLGGKSGNFTNMFDPKVAYSFGIAATISLISGPLADQMFFQRAFAARRNAVAKIFVVGGLAFGVVPIILSLLGFIAAAPSVQQVLTITDPQMVGPQIVGHFLPQWALALFIVLAFAGLSSTLDSSMAAISSLISVDIYKRYVNSHASDNQMLSMARRGMFACAVLGTAIALLQPKLLWVFLVYGALASAMLVPVFFSLYSKKVRKEGVILSIILSVLISLPLSIYANISENANLIVLSAILPPILGLLACSLSTLGNKKAFDYEDFSANLGHEAWRHV